MIKSITLHAFKKHRGLALEFSPGLNLIQGPNYSGKTTVLQGILYALYGYTPNFGGTSAIAHKADDGQVFPAHVDLSFTVGTETYEITRKGKSAQLKQGEEVLATSITAVNSGVTDATRMDRNLFEQLRYSPQNETAAMVFQGSTYLQTLIESLSNTQLIDTVIRKAEAAKAACDAASDVYGEPNIEAANEELESAKRLLEQFTKQCTTTEQRLAEVTKEYKSLISRVQHLQDVFNKRLVWKTELNRLGGVRAVHMLRRQTLDEYLEQHGHVNRQEYEALGSLLAQHQDYVKALAQQHDSVSQAKRAAEIYSLEVGRLTDEQQATQDRITEVEGNPGARSKSQIDALQSAAQASDAALRDLKAHYERLKQALDSAVCPTCQQPVGNTQDPKVLASQCAATYTQVNDATRESGEAHVAYENARLTYQVLQGLRMKYMQQGEALEQAQKRVYICAAAIDVGPLSDLDDARQTMEKVLQQHAVMGQQIQYVEQASEERATLGAAIELLDSQTHECRVSLQNEQDINAEALADWTKRKDQFAADVSELAQQATATRAHREQSASLARAAEEDQKGVMHRLHELEKLRYRKDSASALIKFLRSNRDRFLNQSWDSILSLTSDFVSICTTGEVTKFERSESGVFTYVERGQEQPLVNASGSQKAILGTGMRLALSSIMPVPLDVTLLDEITSDMRDENALIVSQALRTYCRGQVIAVSHRDMDSALADKVIDLS